jgi:hypothetical protein
MEMIPAVSACEMDGQPVDGGGGTTLPVVAPTTQAILAQIPPPTRPLSTA